MFPWLLLALTVRLGAGVSRDVPSDVPNAVPPRHIDSLLATLATLPSPAATIATLATSLRLCATPACRAVLGDPPATPQRPQNVTSGQWHLLSQLCHQPGVLLAPDGSTVAIAPLLAGVAVGLRAGGFGRQIPALSPPADPLLLVTITEALATSFLLAGDNDSDSDNATRAALGPGGCWDNATNPQNFTPAGPLSLVPDPVAIGAMDGVILGTMVARRHQPVTEVLRGYYGGGNGSRSGRPPCSYRRQEFGVLVTRDRLEEEVAAALGVMMSLSPREEVARALGTREVAEVARRAAREFGERYVDCPPIVPRCLWSARPYRGSPSPLVSPLAALFLHHTLWPDSPCRTFDQCARAMRDMQSFHQDTRGWDDIGYSVPSVSCPCPLSVPSVSPLCPHVPSFVAGSDGSLYEGRGWRWVGAHTKGHNSRGFGVAIVGDFRATLPDGDTLSLIRDQLLPCAVRSGHLRPDFVLQGHRQLGHTNCPGDALFREIQSWPGFRGTLGTAGHT